MDSLDARVHDPMYVNREEGDFSLNPSSPAIDYGNLCSTCANAEENCRRDAGYLGGTIYDQSRSE